MEKSLERKTALFIIRLWTEYLQRDPPAFRGEIEHVLSKQKYYFINIEELNQFLLNCSVDYAYQKNLENNVGNETESL